MAEIKANVHVDGVHDVDEAAKLANLGVATVWRWIKAGKIITVTIAGRTLIPSSEVERIKKSQCEIEKELPKVE
jgi:excisionase family DNA binding protein